MAHQPSKGSRLRSLIEAPEILIVPGVFDGFSIRLVERLGYKAALVSGAGLSEARYGLPDVGLMDLTKNVEANGALAAVSSLLLIADADTGYGNPVNVYHAVRDFERAGVAGVMIEDQTWPKRCGHMTGKEVIDAGEMVEKLRAAVDARVDPLFVIKARTDAAGVLGLDEAIRRANLYAEAGADLLFADALLSVEDVTTFCRSVSAPVAVNMGLGLRQRSTTPLMSPHQLQDIGVAVVEYPRLLTAAAVRGMMVAMVRFGEVISEPNVVEEPDLVVSFEELQELVGLPMILEMERAYLSDGELHRKYGS